MEAPSPKLLVANLKFLLFVSKICNRHMLDVWCNNWKYQMPVQAMFHSKNIIRICMTWGGHQKEHSTPVNHILLYVFVIFFPWKLIKKSCASHWKPSVCHLYQTGITVCHWVLSPNSNTSWHTLVREAVLLQSKKTAGSFGQSSTTVLQCRALTTSLSDAGWRAEIVMNSSLSLSMSL